MENVILLQKRYADFVGSNFAVAVNSGTSALHLALLAVGIGKGDEVIVPDFTMAACGFAVAYTGANPVFVDCGNDLNIDVSKIEAKITKNTKAIMAVHIYGRLCDMKSILRIAKKHKLKVIEDACEAQGAVYKSKADITCYSFFKNKIIHAEEGGMCTTDNKKYAKKIAFLKNMAFDKGHTYFHAEVGFNYRLPDSQAALVLKSLKDYPNNAIKRRKIEMWYQSYISTPPRDAVWVYDTPLKWKKEYKDIPGIRHFFRPLSSFPMWGGKSMSTNADYFSKFCYLPVNESMSKKDVKDICKLLRIKDDVV